MFELRIEVEFPAAHHLNGYAGDCARLHGHNWRIEVFARVKHLNSIGMGIDFRELKNAAKELVATWDHQDLNTLPDFAGVNPTAEVMARLFFEKMSQKLSNMGDNTGDCRGAWISRVSVWENERCSASYFRESAGD